MAELYVIPSRGVADIPEQLRNIAAAIEAGEYGEVREGALVLGGDQLDVFGIGSPADGTVAHYLLARGQRKLERIDQL